MLIFLVMVSAVMYLAGLMLVLLIGLQQPHRLQEEKVSNFYYLTRPLSSSDADSINAIDFFAIVSQTLEKPRRINFMLTLFND
jgi:hypothetical protein